MDKEYVKVEHENGKLVIIQVDRMLDKYTAEDLSESYKKQLDRGVIVLEKGAEIYIEEL